MMTVYHMEEVTRAIFTDLVKRQEGYLQSLFAPGGALEEFKDRFIVQEYPPEVSVDMKNPEPHSVAIGFKLKYRIRVKPAAVAFPGPSEDSEPSHE